ncbi:MAG: VCBS repeat-containing protein, partial [Deltaproteobacteria bacterium]|nr:VCBS repeat-containing protein [Deltaproteobacteria bacterium]MBN2673542.1 VCBS repeat-containing protein [Deltaproteobacteria bacterium]
HTDSDSATDSDTHTDSDSATDSDTHTDSDSESESDTTGCTGTPPSCLQDYSGLYNSAGCCAAISVAALCPGGVWECPPGYLIDDACQNFAPDCPILPPEGCGFEYPIFYPAGNNISSVAAGYFNDDSNLDVVAAAIFDNGFTVLTGNGDGTFNPTTTYVNVGETPSSIKVLDLNDDGYSDVAMTFRDDNNIGLFLGNGDTTFNTKIAIPTYTDPYDLAIADINNDNVNDFIVTSNSYDTPRVVVRLAEVSDGIWNGSFQNIKSTITGLGPTGLATGDFNEDGNVDVAVACGLENSIDVLFGRGDGYFNNDLSLISGNNPMLVTVTDLDGDDNDDILVGNQFSDTISIWFGNGDGTFGFREDYGTGNGSRAVEVALFNDDNVPDLIVSNWQDDSLSLLFGTGVSDLTFTGLDSFYSGDGPSRPIIYDFNNDGVPDAVLGSRGEDAIAVMIGYCEEE